MKFLSYQKRWILDESPIKLYRKARRTGITYATSYRSSRKCLRSGKKDSTFIQWVTSRDDMTACEFITDYVSHWAKEANRIAQELAAGKSKFELRDPDSGEVYERLSKKSAQDYVDGWQDVIGLDGKNVEVVDIEKGITAHVVRFKNGARIISLSSNPRAFAGKGGDVLVDEWDLHPDQELVWAMAFPCTIQGDQLEIVSAFDPEGSDQTAFAKLCAECENGLRPDISFHSTNLLEAVDAGYVEMINEIKARKGRPTQTREEFIASIRRGCLTESAYLSQFMCIPNKASGQQLILPEYLSAAQMRLEVLTIQIEGMSQLEERAQLFEPTWWARIFGNGRYALGWDIAATGHLSSIWVNRLLDPTMISWGKPTDEHFALILMHGCSRLSRQRDLVDAMFQATGNIVGCGDKTGLGLSECTELELKYRIDDKSSRFVGVNFSASKFLLGSTMQAAFEQGRQKLSAELPYVVTDIAGIKKDASTKTQKMLFVESKNELLPDSHCDIAWSDALAIFAGDTLITDGRFFGVAAKDEPAPGGRNAFNNPRRNIDDLGNGSRCWR